MNKPLFGMKIALLVANGFCEQDMTETQRALAEAGAHARIISPELGLVNGWTGDSWGHHFAVDTQLSTALGADYNMLIVPGGERSHNKLKLTGHTRRFLSSFIAARKPVVIMNDAVSLMLATDTVRDKIVGGPSLYEPQVLEAGGDWSAETLCHGDMVLSGAINADNRPAFIKAMIAFLIAPAMQDEQQANQAA